MKNYESKYWGLIYDQMMERDLSDWLEANRAFYLSSLGDITGPVLECACGTGLILLKLLDHGLDTYGFDASNAMLDTLRSKATADVGHRISNQQFESFSYDKLFDAYGTTGPCIAEFTMLFIAAKGNGNGKGR